MRPFFNCLEVVPGKCQKKTKSFQEKIGGVINGVEEKFYSNGQIRSRFNYKSGERDGEFSLWDEDGKLTSKGTYLNEQLHGPCQDWYENGRYEFCTWENGVPHGLYQLHYSNGIMSRQCNLVNNRPDGLETLWDESGKLMAEVNYKNGAVHGLYTLYRQDGSIIKKVEYENGKLKQDNNV